jgi:hypothetical protein
MKSAENRPPVPEQISESPHPSTRNLPLLFYALDRREIAWHPPVANPTANTPTRAPRDWCSVHMETILFKVKYSLADDVC